MPVTLPEALAVTLWVVWWQVEKVMVGDFYWKP